MCAYTCVSYRIGTYKTLVRTNQSILNCVAQRPAPCVGCISRSSAQKWQCTQESQGKVMPQKHTALPFKIQTEKKRRKAIGCGPRNINAPKDYGIKQCRSNTSSNTIYSVSFWPPVQPCFQTAFFFPFFF